MQGRALHSDKLSRARDIAAKTVDLGEQILALKFFSRLTERQCCHDTRQDNLACVIIALQRVTSREFFGANVPVAVAQNKQPLDHVFQLTQIPRPSHRLQKR